jgi:hypothetical protein
LLLTVNSLWNSLKFKTLKNYNVVCSNSEKFIQLKCYYNSFHLINVRVILLTTPYSFLRIFLSFLLFFFFHHFAMLLMFVFFLLIGFSTIKLMQRRQMKKVLKTYSLLCSFFPCFVYVFLFFFSFFNFNASKFHSNYKQHRHFY